MTQSSITRPSALLRRALQADALVSGAMALLLSLAAGTLSRLLALPQPLLLETGLFLIGYAALVGWLGTRRALPKALVLIVIGGNALWTLGSVALLLSGMVAPNALGVAFVLIQATAVGIFAELQFIGLKRSDAAVAA
ncbi:hypothetical protein [Rhodopseudomonas palustris]|uniref:Integral membrane protein n=1 Tax=Rhodopseudomonas palustris (strain ATCC BAA-98 / CGA009) TaxID=258594 RepID=Q6N325_RHOPA|nr:hypothetical protein [Rhodopseudomonas palustris]OPF92709.1 hypothetical protein B1S06_16275 [Rhodopseudomonas palustris]PPQ41166.1 hypothetical protein CKO39_23520 [Rhodopseudomonas palustris]QQM05427.1 hypothetical protein I8G32_03996 [Rhodopseudomonas palustris]RJF63192.1 hypothetical protein D4Q71_15430 [Rhodopseudomonas palustris]WAB76767.1 hypothetical protein OR798_20060 [Rhodopseudomonas palustris]